MTLAVDRAIKPHINKQSYLSQSLLLPHWSVPVSTVTTDLTQSLLLPPWPIPVSSVTTDQYMSVLLPHWPVPVSTFTTLICIWMAYHCYMCMSLLLPLWPVHVSTVTTFTCISLYCYHTNLYQSALLPHRPQVPVYCYHTDLPQSILLPHWHVPVSTVTTNMYVYLLLSH